MNIKEKIVTNIEEEYRGRISRKNIEEDCQRNIKKDIPRRLVI